MLVPTILLILPFLLHLPPTALAQETSDVYTGYSLEFTGDDPASATYATANTASNTTYPVPDVYVMSLLLRILLFTISCFESRKPPPPPSAFSWPFMHTTTPLSSPLLSTIRSPH